MTTSSIISGISSAALRTEFGFSASWNTSQLVNVCEGAPVSNVFTGDDLTGLTRNFSETITVGSGVLDKGYAGLNYASPFGSITGVAMPAYQGFSGIVDGINAANVGGWQLTLKISDAALAVLPPATAFHSLVIGGATYTRAASGGLSGSEWKWPGLASAPPGFTVNGTLVSAVIKFARI